MIQHSRTYMAIPPGDTLKEIIDDRGITEGQLAVRIGKDETFVRDLITGEVELTQEVAQVIETAMDIPAYFLLNLELLYRENLVKIDRENAKSSQRKAKLETEKTKATIAPQAGLVASG